MQQRFPLYEEFWRIHVFPLRGPNGPMRGDIDKRLELMATDHYKCLISFSTAVGGLTSEDHPEQTFNSLQNAGNRARGVVETFNDIRAECVPDNPNPIDSKGFSTFCSSIAEYRNYIHEDVMGMVEHEGRMYLPKPEKLEQYKRWSRLRNADVADFKPVSDLLSNWFERLARLLEEDWRMMLDLSGEVLKSPRYRQLLPPQAQPQVAPRTVARSNIYRPTKDQFRSM